MTRNSSSDGRPGAAQGLVSWRALVAVVVLAIMGTAACGENAAPEMPMGNNDPPGTQEVAGSYSATVFTVTEGGTTTDLLAQGASIDLLLKTDGQTSGRLFVPGGNEDGSDLDADLTGTWSISGSSVNLTQTADTFLRDMTFVVGNDNTLEGEETFGSATVRVSLQKG